ncbi:unnamed protein product [Heligmosomoides polygyrus]|uniref:Helicase C-terminal domain-containing protein n=1 Tax=Heligmosomoides polygyrus TaxID=6339 RepID=A0A183GV97_HELPZ|nr:unnamed protein product [Heligmosomoides polygyrus]
MKPDSTLPQIIGLTASLGVGGGSNEEEAITHVVKLCALLDCKVISTVRRNASELMQYSPIVCDEICPCDDRNDHMRMQYLDILCHLMRIFEEYLNAVYKICPCDDRSDHMRMQYLDILCHLMRIFEEYLNAVYTKCATKPPAGANSASNIGIIEENPKYRTYNCFERAPEEKTTQAITKGSISFRQLIANSNSDFRALVFIRTRRGASVLAKILNSHPILSNAGLRVECVAGLSRGICETTTKREQLEKLQR